MERRKFNRILFSADAVIRQQDKEWRTQLFDLSLKGALIARPDGEPLDTQDTLILYVQLQGTELQIQLKGHVSHQKANKLGFSIDYLDIDSATKLRRLMELNMGDEALLHQDLEALCRQSQTHH